MNKQNRDDVEVMKKSDARQLLKDAQNGNADAFAEAFEPLRQFVFAVACRLVGIDDADDVVMDTYLKAWQALPRFRRGASLKTWLYRITRNCSLDHIRKLKRRKEISIDNEDELYITHDVPDDNQPSADTLLAGKETRKTVQIALEKLSDNHRIALQLRYSDDLTYSEIAAVTGVSTGTVMSRLFNGKRKLRKVIESGLDL